MKRLTSLVSAVAAGALVAVTLVAAPAHAAVQTAATLFSQLSIAPDVTTGYFREAFFDWADADGDGCDTRAEVLEGESLAAVTMDAGCVVQAGQWYSPYDGVTSEAASDVDVDHLVPLAEAWRSGATRWTSVQRKAFANDLGFAGSLNAMTDDLSPAKSDRDPAGWLPPVEETQCAYVADWVAVKWRWSLTMDTSEAAVLASLVAGECGATEVDVTQELAPLPPIGNSLTVDVSLRTGQQLVSADGRHRFAVQADGNALLREVAGSGLWSTRTAGRDGIRLLLRGDGNLYLYDSAGAVIWTSGTAGSGATRLTLFNDGALKLRTRTGAVVWSTGALADRITRDQYLLAGKVLVSGNGKYKLTMGITGNTTVRAVRSSRLIWSAGTTGLGGTRLKMAPGRLSMMTTSGDTVWSRTRGGADRLVLRNDGSLVLVDAAGGLLWGTPKDPMLKPPPPPLPAPAPAPAPAPVPAPQPAPAPTPPRPASPDLDCPHFASQAEAQRTFEYWRARGLGDVHRLDADNDGLACESHFR